MICNVVLLNLSLAYSSIQFYQIVRVLVTPCVAGLNYVITKATIPVRAALTLIPVCAGVAVVSYFDTAGKKGSDRGTSLLGVVFGFAALFASAIYTVWIDKYHKKLECTSMQLLLNQAPVSVLVMLYIIPLSDDVTAWATIDGPMWLLVIFVKPSNQAFRDFADNVTEWHPSLPDKSVPIPHHQGSWAGEQHSRRALQDLLDHYHRLDLQSQTTQGRESARHPAGSRRHRFVSHY